MEINELLETVVSLLEKGDYQTLRSLLDEQEPYDLSCLCEELDEASLPIVFRIMSRDTAAECFSEMEADVQEALIRRLTDAELRAVLNELYIDDTVDIIEEMPANVVKRILRHSTPEMRSAINRLREEYPEIVFISFPGDEKSSGGCLAAGRGFFHINSHGGAEPCPVSAFSDINVKDTSLRAAIDSGLFAALRDGRILNEDHAGGCVLYEKKDQVEAIIKQLSK